MRLNAGICVVYFAALDRGHHGGAAVRDRLDEPRLRQRLLVEIGPIGRLRAGGLERVARRARAARRAPCRPSDCRRASALPSGARTPRARPSPRRATLRAIFPGRFEVLASTGDSDRRLPARRLYGVPYMSTFAATAPFELTLRGFSPRELDASPSGRAGSTSATAGGGSRSAGCVPCVGTLGGRALLYEAKYVASADAE